MALAAGTRLGPYEILSLLGAGGMGEVYRERDTKLSRDVALKVLPEALAKDAERLARFRREAQVLASLNHPHIATIYGLEESNGNCALVMELVEGPTLAERIASATVGADRALPTGKDTPRGAPTCAPMPMDEALPIAKQIAEGLEYQHERGIIHRDLKPANVKVRPDGTLKILDFGLAKALEETPAAGSISTSPTISAAATREGMILGTAAYMSPERARGKPVDKRTDIWTFGVVLNEMLTGKQLFSGTVSDTLAAVITKEPDWGALPASTPQRIRQLLRRCLTKDPKQRLQAIGEARITIEETLAGPGDVGPTLGSAWAGRAPPLQVWRRAMPWALAVVFLLTAIVSSLSYWRLARAPTRTIIFEIQAPEKDRFGSSSYFGSAPVISPDGGTVAFTAIDAAGKTRLWVRPLDSPAAKFLPGTEGAADPFWSADSRSLGFFADNKLKTIEASGGPALVVADASGGGRRELEPRRDHPVCGRLRHADLSGACFRRHSRCRHSS